MCRKQMMLVVTFDGTAVGNKRVRSQDRAFFAIIRMALIYHWQYIQPDIIVQ